MRSGLRGHVTFSHPLLQISRELHAEVFLGQLHVRADTLVERLEVPAPHRRGELERQQKIILADVVGLEIFRDTRGRLGARLECFQSFDVCA